MILIQLKNLWMKIGKASQSEITAKLEELQAFTHMAWWYTLGDLYVQVVHFIYGRCKTAFASRIGIPNY